MLLAGALLAGSHALAQGERCAVEPVIQHPTVSGEAGPLAAPVGPELYEHLIDRPALVAALLTELGLPRYRVEPRGEARYWVDDGEGAQGLFVLVRRGRASRIYLVDGVHEGRMLPQVRACAVLILTFEQAGAQEVSTRVLVHARLDDPWIAGLATVLSPLAGYLVSRKLSRGVEAATQLATLIAQDPQRVAQAAGRVPWLAPDERRELLRLMPQAPAAPPRRRRRRASRCPAPATSSRC